MVNCDANPQPGRAPVTRTMCWPPGRQWPDCDSGCDTMTVTGWSGSWPWVLDHRWLQWLVYYSSQHKPDETGQPVARTPSRRVGQTRLRLSRPGRPGLGPGVSGPGPAPAAISDHSWVHTTSVKASVVVAVVWPLTRPEYRSFSDWQPVAGSLSQAASANSDGGRCDGGSGSLREIMNLVIDST